MREMQSVERSVVRSIQGSVDVKTALLQDPAFHNLLVTVGLKMAQAIRDGHKVFFLGNGGSAADAQHLAAELTGRYLRDRPALPGIALTVNTSSMTAIANDFSFDAVFARQLEALSSIGDVAIGISSSGESANVLSAMKVGHERGLVTIGMTGRTGGKLKHVVDYCICIPSDETPRVQESHILAGHILCEIIEAELFDEDEPLGPQTA
jgi:D-sedoheptulose 7-phosphate isomerase